MIILHFDGKMANFFQFIFIFYIDMLDEYGGGYAILFISYI